MSNKLKNKLKKVIKEQLYTEPTVDASGALIDPDRIIKDKETRKEDKKKIKQLQREVQESFHSRK